MGDGCGGGKTRGRGDALHILHHAQLRPAVVKEQRRRLGHLGGDGIGLGVAIFGGDYQGDLILPRLQGHFPHALDGSLGVGGGGGDGDLLGALGQREGVLGHSRVKGRSQCPGADSEGREGVVGALAGGIVRLAVVGLGGGNDGHRGAAGGCFIVVPVHGKGALGDPNRSCAGIIGPKHKLIDTVVPIKAHGSQVAGLQGEVAGIGHRIGPRLTPGGHGDGKGHRAAHADSALPGGNRKGRGVAHLHRCKEHGTQQHKADKGFFQ